MGRVIKASEGTFRYAIARQGGRQTAILLHRVLQAEIEYSLFSINIDPDALGTLYDRVQSVLRSPRKLLAMQRNLEKIQVSRQY